MRNFGNATILSGACLLASCATTSTDGIVPIGSDLYMVGGIGKFTDFCGQCSQGQAFRGRCQFLPGLGQGDVAGQQHRQGLRLRNLRFRGGPVSLRGDGRPAFARMIGATGQCRRSCGRVTRWQMPIPA